MLGRNKLDEERQFDSEEAQRPEKDGGETEVNPVTPTIFFSLND